MRVGVKLMQLNPCLSGVQSGCHFQHWRDESDECSRKFTADIVRRTNDNNSNNNWGWDVRQWAARSSSLQSGTNGTLKKRYSSQDIWTGRDFHSKIMCCAKHTGSVFVVRHILLRTFVRLSSISFIDKGIFRLASLQSMWQCGYKNTTDETLTVPNRFEMNYVESSCLRLKMNTIREKIVLTKFKC